MKIKKYFVVLFFIAFYINDSKAQVIVNPIFDRSDEPLFRIEKVEITPDTTYISCSYHAEEGSWACLYDKTYLEYTENGTRLPIIKVTGLPLYPNQKYFSRAEDVQVVLYFPHICADKINLIESDDNESFNIYGIDLKKSYDCYYSVNDVEMFFNSAMTNEKNGNWLSAISDLQKQLEASKYVFGIRSKEASWPMFTLTNQYSQLGEYEKMIEWGIRAIDILTTLPQDSINLDVLARSYGNVGTAYYLLKQPDISVQYMELSLATRRIKEGVGTLNYEEYLMEIAKRYYYEENYPKALLYGKEAVDIYERKFRNNSSKNEYVYIRSLNNLCEFYNKMGYTKDAVITGKQALQLINRESCRQYSWLKSAIINNLGGALAYNGQIDEGIALLESNLEEGKLNNRLRLASIYLDYKQDTIRALREYETALVEIEDSMSIGKKDYFNYSAVLEALFRIYKWNDFDVAKQYLEKAVNLQKEWNGDYSIAYAKILLQKIGYLWITSSFSTNKDIDNLILNTRQATDIIKRHINNTSFNMSKKERQIYWQHFEEYFTWFIPTICGLYDTEIGNSLAYDAALFYKGMLLMSEKEFKTIIHTSNDNELDILYQEYSNHLSELEKLYSINSKYHTIDSLKSLIKSEEYLLSQKVTRFNRQYKGTDFSWREIKKQLKKGDVAIEILSYQGIDGKNVYYDAYVIDFESKAPKLIPLCSEEKLKSLISDSIDYKGLSMLFWGNKKMYTAIKDAKNIYFSTSGLLNTIGIEYLPIADNRYIYDRFNLYRLSSTREICLKDDTTAINKVCLYGGLDYNCSNEQSPYKEIVTPRLSRSAIESLAHRGGFDILVGSMQEVEQVKSVMSKKKIECVVFSGTDGTEESFKQLSGRHMGIIHLSTHGMYIPDDKTKLKETNNFRFIMSNETSNVDEEDIFLSRSFLVMSGGNALINRDSIAPETEDGILTALEVSHLDLTDLDLVVLSACETALGEITPDGVYGLQRGFKKAGANTILMSLDKVDDEATRILMVEFYRNLMNGKSKLQSLHDAQQYLRIVENGKYNDPKFWASFIMLDGLN